MTDTHEQYTDCAHLVTCNSDRLHRRAIAVLACLRADLGLWGLVKLMVRECFR